MSFNKDLGNKGEEMAQEFLKNKGFEILETNWTYQRAEVDIIVQQANLLIFVEVKTRSTDYFGRPEEAVHQKKQKLLAKAADAYLKINELEQEVRFDIIAIIHNKTKTLIRHIEEAFFPFETY